MPTIKIIKKTIPYALPNKSLFALTFGKIRSDRRVGGLRARYVLHIV